MEFTGTYWNNWEIKSEIFKILKTTFLHTMIGKVKFLFQAFITSEGSDSFQEGYIRYRENDKSGLYSDKGNKVTLAKYD
jgi:hypothetical protein